MKYILLLCVMALCLNTEAQKLENATFDDIVSTISSTYSVEIYCHCKSSDLPVHSIQLESLSLGDALRDVVQRYGLVFIETIEGRIHLIPSQLLGEEAAQIAQVNMTLEEAKASANMSKALNSFLSSGKAVITVLVKDGKSGELLPGAIVLNQKTGETKSTNLDGQLLLMTTIGYQTLSAQSNGYTSADFRLNIQSDSLLTLELYEKSMVMDEIVISGNTMEDKVNSNFSSVESLSIKEIEKQPALFGEVDIIKSLTAVTGVSSAGEGAGGFNVRGGSIDQNLVMYDNIPVFYTSHLFGLFSIFNTESIEGVSLYKGGIPAQYGGRLSSVLQVNAKRGETEKAIVGGSLGTISSKLYWDGPVGEKTSVLAGGRVAYPNYLLQFVPRKDIQNSKAGFYDANVKLSHRIKENEIIDVTTYVSGDNFRFDQDTTFSWSNLLLSANYSRLTEGGRVMNIGISHSGFSTNIDNQAQANNYTYKGGVEFTGLNYSNALQRGDTDVVWGVSTSLYTVDLGTINPNTAESSVLPTTSGKETGQESGVFIDYSKPLNGRLTMNAGIRLSHFMNVGGGNSYVYSSGLEKRPSNIIDTTRFSGFNPRNSYMALEPRLNLNYKPDLKSSIKFGFNRMTQYLHLISNTTASAPQDVWKLSDEHIAPQISYQANIGYFRQFNHFQTGVEIYYKRLLSLVEFKDGARLVLNPAIETALTLANGHSFGAEFNISGKREKLVYELNYTFSESLRKTNSAIEAETINQNEYYPAQFNRPHDLFVSFSYTLTKRIQLGMNFIYTSGRPITIPTSAYLYNDRIVANYSERNQSNIPDYHRADLSLFIDESLKKQKKYANQWRISIYNLYARRNPYSVFFRPIANGRLPQAYKVSILGAMLPSVSYTFKFIQQ